MLRPPTLRPALLCAVLSGILAPRTRAAEDGPPVSYNFQVRPILAEHCFKCHGADEKQRKAKLRLDIRESAIAKKAVVPGKAEGSELVKRLLSRDEEEIMPPPKEHRPVSAEKLAILRRWIDQGGNYERHWAFVPPSKPKVPPVAHPGRIENEIDAFVQARLEREGLAPAPLATKQAWLRRVTLDLTGLPLTVEEAEAFGSDASPAGFTKVLDRLLASPAFGEHLATDWLDVARYADTFGRHEDSDSENWPYRDWVVRAFNQNLPFDQFVMWQTAGDMFPGATSAMHLATHFNRLVQQSNEAGSDEEEFRCEHVADRMKTNGIAFLGLSLECARCHDHKYDPLTQRDYYAMSSFLANVDELGLYSRYTDAVPAPSMFLYEGDDERRHADLKLSAGLDAASRGYELILEDGRPSFALSHFHPGNALRIRATHRVPLHSWTHLACTYDGSSEAAGMRIFVNGFQESCEVIRDHLYKDIIYEKTARDLTDVEDVGLAAGGRSNDKALRDAAIDELMCFDVELSPVEVRILAGIGIQTRPQEWFEWYLREVDGPWRDLTRKLTQAREAENELSMKLREIMVMREMPFAPWPAYVLERGRFDARREKVAPARAAAWSMAAITIANASRSGWQAAASSPASATARPANWVTTWPSTR